MNHIKYLLLILNFIGCISLSKSHTVIDDFKIELAIKGNGGFEVTAEITNSSTMKKAYYIPNKQDLCSSILNLIAIDSQGRSSRLFPCDIIIDLEGFNLTESNSELLKPNENIKFSIKFNLEEFEPLLSDISYKLILIYDSTKVIPSKKASTIFTNVLESNYAVLVNKQ